MEAPLVSNMAEVHRIVRRAARSRTTVLLTGETGVGKERVARALHEAGEGPGPWVAVNCGALPEDLAESLLFGHTKGAFTGADRDRPGKIREADGGTLFLDEIGELSPTLQVKLLRVLQEREVEPLGGVPVPVELRVVAATHRELLDEVGAGRFREDLYYRISVLRIHIPALRDRKSEIPGLVTELVESLCRRLGRPVPRLAPDLVAYLSACPWRGNVRELENVLEATLVLSEEELLELSSLPRTFRKESFLEGFQFPAAAAAAASPVAPTLPAATAPAALVGAAYHLADRVAAFERDAIQEALTRYDGIKKDAAEALGISPRAMSYYLRKHGL